MWDQASIRQAIASTCTAHAQQQCGFASRSSESSAVTQECLKRAEAIPPKDLILPRSVPGGSLEITDPTEEILGYQETSQGLHSISLGQNLSRSILGNPPNCDQFKGTGASQTNRGAALIGETDQKKSPAKMEAAHSWIRDFNLVSLHTTHLGSSVGNVTAREFWMQQAMETTNFNEVWILLGGLCLTALSLLGLFSPGTTSLPWLQQTSPVSFPVFFPEGSSTPPDT